MSDLDNFTSGITFGLSLDGLIPWQLGALVLAGLVALAVLGIRHAVRPH